MSGKMPPIPKGITEGVDFLNQTFVKDPEVRPGASTLLAHAWKMSTF